jgi:hypothetical protein
MNLAFDGRALKHDAFSGVEQYAQNINEALKTKTFEHCLGRRKRHKPCMLPVLNLYAIIDDTFLIMPRG